MITMPAQEQRPHPSLTAEFVTPGDARAAMKALENHGIDGLEITVLDGPEDGDRRPADRRELVFISGRVGKGIALGAVVGAAVLGIVGVIAAIAGAPAVLIVAFVVFGAGLAPPWARSGASSGASGCRRTGRRPSRSRPAPRSRCG